MKKTTCGLLIGTFLWCLLLLGFRAVYWHSQSYFFLPYNLGLAAIPLLLSYLVRLKSAIWVKLALSLAWLLFFPNAPYLLTDLVHLAHNRTAPIFYDVVMLLSFAGTGAAMGFLSLQQMQNLLGEKGCPRLSWIFAIGCLFLSSFGIYLGRVQRLNSWDVLVRPFRLLASVAAPVVNPTNHLATWAMTLSLGVLLSLAYLFIVCLRPKLP